MTIDPLNAASYTGAGSVTFIGLTAETWGIVGVICGIVIALLTYGTNVWFKLRAEKRRK